jgi:hypothetical protein
MRALSAVTLRPEAQRALAARLRSAPRPRPYLSAWWFTLRWSASLGLVLLILLIGLWVTAAARSTLPTQTLYPLKRAIEQVELTFTAPAQQAAAHANLGQERTRELVELVGQGRTDPALLEPLAAEIAAATTVALNAIEATPAAQRVTVLTQILRYVQAQQNLVQAIQVQAPLAEGLADTLQTLIQHQQTAEHELAQLHDNGRLPIKLDGVA